VETSKKRLQYYRDSNDQEPCLLWINQLRDGKGRGVIRTRLNRLESGNTGDCRPVGEGVHELRIEFGPGYRVYFGNDGDELVILLGGGDKKTQDADIKKACERWKEYNA
jgi:putative addiction module killer protein